MSHNLAEKIAAIIDPKAWDGIARQSERLRTQIRHRQTSSLKRARSILELTHSNVFQAKESCCCAAEQRATNAEALLSSMMIAGDMMAQALGEASDSFGFMHACMFGAEQHLRNHVDMGTTPDADEGVPF